MCVYPPGLNPSCKDACVKQQEQLLGEEAPDYATDIGTRDEMDSKMESIPGEETTRPQNPAAPGIPGDLQEIKFTRMGERRRMSLEEDGKWVYHVLELPEECCEPKVPTAQQKQVGECWNAQKPDVDHRIIPFLGNWVTANASPTRYEESAIEGLWFLADHGTARDINLAVEGLDRYGANYEMGGNQKEKVKVHWGVVSGRGLLQDTGDGNRRLSFFIVRLR